jgi:outer membrane protein
MKNISLIFNIVLSIAVIVLFVLHFSGKKEKKAGTAKGADSTQIGPPTIVFLDLDSLSMEYRFIKDVSAQSELLFKEDIEKVGSLENQLKVKYNQMKDPSLTQRGAEKLQQEIANLGAEVQEKMAMQQQGIMVQLADTILNAYNHFAAETKADVIYGYHSTQDNVMIKNSNLVITKQVIDFLNARYKGVPQMQQAPMGPMLPQQ